MFFLGLFLPAMSLPLLVGAFLIPGLLTRGYTGLAGHRSTVTCPPRRRTSRIRSCTNPRHRPTRSLGLAVVVGEEGYAVEAHVRPPPARESAHHVADTDG